MNAPTTLASGLAAPFVARYQNQRGRLPGEAAPREAAARYLERHGFPSQRDEAWKYTSLRTLADIGLQETLTHGDRGQALLPEWATPSGLPRVVFVAGNHQPDLSDIVGAARVRSFTENGLGKLARPEREPMAALNTMLAEDGAAIEVDAGVDAGTLLLIHVGQAGSASHPRHAVHLAENARLTLIEIAIGDGAYLHNPVIEVTLGNHSELAHVRLQAESPDAFHLATIYAEIASGAHYDGFTLTLGARLARCEIHARLGGPHGRVAVNAAQLLGGSQHGDFTTVVLHDAPHGTSRQTVKNVLSQHSRAVFQGKIEVARAAQKTDGYQMNQTLLLSPDAEIDAKPQLEIYADDVKCSHGATVGELDADQLFYLRSRGISAEQAKAILVDAFLADALDLVANPAARKMLEDALLRARTGNAS